MRKTLLSIVSVLACISMFAQGGIKVTGTVEDVMGPVIGAAVIEQGTSNGAVTDFDGNFTLVVSSTDAIVEVSCIGYATQSFKASEMPERILLSEDSMFLQEVVVVGYGTQKAKDLTAPIASVKGSELGKQTAANPMSALQGMMSGVQITQSGAPGSAPAVKIRGVGSIGDYASPLYVVDGAFVDNIDFLSSSDIESLTVLKDASAAAIYGVRAANGVILVTTRKGSQGHTNISYSGYAGVQVPTNIMKLANKEQYIELYNLAFDGTKGFVPKKASDYPGDTDWYAALVKPAFTHEHSLDVSGATEKTNYSIGLGYYYQDGIMNHATSDYDRINFRSRLDQKASDWLSVGINNIFSNYSRNDANTNAYYQAFVNPPVYNIYNDANTEAYPVKFDSPQLYGYANAYGNPVATAYYNDSLTHGIKDVFSTYAEIVFIPEKLKFRSSYNMDFSFWQSRNYGVENFVGGSQGTKTSSLSKTMGYTTNQIIDNLLTYNDRKGQHTYSVMLGQSTRMYYSGTQSGTVYNVPNFDEQSKYLSLGSYKNQSATDSGVRYNGVSVFTRATYNYADKYLATFTFRADGSSKYQEKWGFFPSLGLGWNLTQEDFMQNQSTFQNLKIRASWGLLGNDNIPANSMAILGSSGLGASGLFGETVIDGQGAQTVLQNFLKWEVVSEANFGVDYAMLGGRLTGEFDIFSRTTSNVVFYVPIAAGGGKADLLANNGKVNNSGIEWSVAWADSIGDFGYNVGMNATLTRNRVKEITGRENIPGASVNGSYATITKVGYPIGSFWGYEVDGVYKSEVSALKDPIAQSNKLPGYFKYKDQNDDQAITEADKVYLGSPIPWLTLGMNFGFKWKNFDGNIILASQVGNKILNAKRMNHNVFSDANYDLDFYKHAWRPDAPSDTYPSPAALGASSILQCNSFFVEDGSYLRIQNVQIGYNFTGIRGIKNLRVYVSAQRPLTLFGYNGFTTEIGGSPISAGVDNSVYPLASIYSGGVSFNF